MNRRYVFSIFVVGLALCMIALAFPEQPANANHAPQSTEAATVDPCNPKPLLPGILTSDQVLYDGPSNANHPLIQVKAGDVVEVLGKNKTGFWVLVTTHANITAWAPSPYVAINKTKFASMTVLDDNAIAEMSSATEAPTMAGTEAATVQATPCPGIPGTVTGDGIPLRLAPNGKAKNEGVTLKRGDAVQVVALNSSGSWFKVRKGTDEGWVGSAFVFIRPGAAALIPHDYTDVEITLTPVS